jgi:hypothetical protein
MFEISWKDVVLIVSNDVICDMNERVYCYRFFLSLYMNKVPEMHY